MNYRPPSLEEFAELRRGLPVFAAVLLLIAVLLPMWVIDVYAIQYPGEVLHLELYAYPHISGDYWEMAELNQYIGFYYPDPVYWQPNYEVHPRAVDVPEWSVGPLAFVAVAAAGAFVGVAPNVRKLKQGLKWQLVGSISVFTVLLVDIQYRLYQTGHQLDPDAPVIGVDPFTPPIWGKYEVANITSYSRLGSGAFVTVLAIGLLVVAFYYRDTSVTFRDIPAEIGSGIDGIRNRIRGRTGGPEAGTPGPSQGSK
jgi:hypothetical protein